jgi:hypothetical protein
VLELLVGFMFGVAISIRGRVYMVQYGFSIRDNEYHFHMYFSLFDVASSHVGCSYTQNDRDCSGRGGSGKCIEQSPVKYIHKRHIIRNEMNIINSSLIEVTYVLIKCELKKWLITIINGGMKYISLQCCTYCPQEPSPITKI